MNTNLLDNAIALSVTISKIGTRRKVDSRKVQIKESEGEQPESDAIAVNKELISCPSFDAITKLDGDFRTRLYKLALPNPLFRNGTYLIPVSMVEYIDEMVETYKNERANKISAFVADYRNAVTDARSRLGGLFNINDYPDIETVRGSFQVVAQYIEIGLPAALGSISPEIFNRERAAFNDKLVSAADEITAAMRESFKELVDHMVERLKPGADGKPKIFRDSLVNNFKEFMDTFSARNITNDTDLEALVSKAKDILGGKSAEDLRNYDSIRENVVSGISEIKEQLSGMVIDAPKRKFNFDE
ncbi:MAG: hypothetical protein PHN44_00190 [Candidatus Marinimicrobia bacterium]|nr:hypothetical protein [Candidatus Neomarinimicrobiota bacterium]